MDYKITIITVCYNAVSCLEKTILSVINQSYDNIEYIIIDGNSTDGSLDIINKYAHRISRCVSEPDNGIFDAMNKGIEFSTGEWCLFLNCGDYFYACDSVERGVSLIDEDADVVYGDTEYRFDYGDEVLKPLPLEKVLTGAFCCHQSAFFKTAVIKEYKYDLSYAIISDWVLFRQLYLDGKKFKYVPVVISSFDNKDGASTANNVGSLRKHIKEKGRCLGIDRRFTFNLSLSFKLFCFVVRRSFIRFMPRPIYNKLKRLWIHLHR